MFVIALLTCAEHAEYIDVRCSTNQLHEFKPLKFTSAPRVYDMIFHADICQSKVGSYIWMLTVFGPAVAQIAVTVRVCCLFVLAEPGSLFICTVGCSDMIAYSREKLFIS